MSLTLEEKTQIVSNFGKKSTNSGLTEVQIALLNQKINRLQEHFKKNRKDYHSRIGLLRMVSKRKKMLNYLRSKNISRYENIIKELKIRHHN